MLSKSGLKICFGSDHQSHVEVDFFPVPEGRITIFNCGYRGEISSLVYAVSVRAATVNYPKNKPPEKKKAVKFRKGYFSAFT